MAFHSNILSIDCEKEAGHIAQFIKQQKALMKREGAVLGLSGGVDSALSAELCVKAFGKDRVFGLILPEKESNPISKDYALKQAQKMGIETEVVDISGVLEGFGAYEKRDSLIREVFPEYHSKCRVKLTLPSDLLARDSLNFFTLTIDDGAGTLKSLRLNKKILKGIIAATDIKQRVRMINLYYYAEKMNYLVCGTTNKSEAIQGFYVKYGDGGVDIEPIAHLYKTQVYQLSEYLGVIQEIIQRTPSPDTFSFPVSDEEFYFRIPYEKLDMLLYAWENRISFEEAGKVMQLTKEQVERAFRDFMAKFKATEHLRILPPQL